jgi:hypothetical protein
MIKAMHQPLCSGVVKWLKLRSEIEEERPGREVRDVRTKFR